MQPFLLLALLFSLTLAFTLLAVMVSKAILALTFLAVAACASPGVHIKYFDTGTRAPKEVEKRARATPLEDTHGLKIYEHRLPRGFSFKKKDPFIELNYDQLKFEKVAHFKTDAQIKWYDYAGFTFYSYDWPESARAYYCYPQVPLVWLTLAAWNLIPLHYPCNPLPDLDLSVSEDNRNIQMPFIKRIATALFATHIVIVRWGREKSSAEVFLFRETR